MVWAAAWIDGREALREAYGQVLRVGDAARRAELIEELARVPVEMADVAALREERRRRERTDARSLETWKARQRIDIAARFRRHYEAVAAKAAEARR
jgi:hypothetical protein